MRHGLFLTSRSRATHLPTYLDGKSCAGESTLVRSRRSLSARADERHVPGLKSEEAETCRYQQAEVPSQKRRRLFFHYITVLFGQRRDWIVCKQARSGHSDRRLRFAASLAVNEEQTVPVFGTCLSVTLASRATITPPIATLVADSSSLFNHLIAHESQHRHPPMPRPTQIGFTPHSATPPQLVSSPALSPPPDSRKSSNRPRTDRDAPLEQSFRPNSSSSAPEIYINMKGSVARAKSQFVISIPDRNAACRHR